MARKIEIELSEEERAELERLTRSETRPFREVQRARMILYSAASETDGWIAERLDCTPECVGKWRRRFGAQRLQGLTDLKRAGRPRRFPPEQVAEVKAIACELPRAHGLPLGRFTRLSCTGWWSSAASPTPRRRRSGAGWTLRRSSPGRCAPGSFPATPTSPLPPVAGRPSLVEFEYRRGGALANLAAWDVHHANPFGRVEEKTGDRALRALGGGSDDERAPRLCPLGVLGRRQRLLPTPGGDSIERLEGVHENPPLIHLPIHACWLNQIELCSSFLGRSLRAPGPHRRVARNNASDHMSAERRLRPTPMQYEK